MAGDKQQSKAQENAKENTPTQDEAQSQDFGSNTANQQDVSEPDNDDGYLQQNTADTSKTAAEEPEGDAPDAVSPEEKKEAVEPPKPHELAKQDLDGVVERMTEAIAKDPSQRAEILSKSAAEMAAVFGQLEPDQVQKVLDAGGRQSLDAMTARASGLRGDQRAGFIENLAATGESMGREHVQDLAKSFLKNMGGSSKALNDSTVLDGIEQGMRTGNGSLFGAALIKESANQYGKVPDALMDRFGDTAGDIGKQYHEAVQAASLKNHHLSKWEQNATAMGVGAEHIAAGANRFRNEKDNKKVYDKLESTSDVFAANLEGQAYALEMLDGLKYAGGWNKGDSILDGHKVDDPDSVFHDQTMRDAFESNLYTAGQLTLSGTGRDQLAHKVIQSGQGRRTWLDTAQGLRGKFDKRAKEEADGRRHISYSDQLDQAVWAGGDQALTAMQANNDIGGVVTAMGGLANQTRYTDADLADAIQNSGQDYQGYVDEWSNGVKGGKDFVGGVGKVFAESAKSKRFEGDDALNTRRRSKLERIGGAVTLGSAGLAMMDGVEANEALAASSGAVGMYSSIRHAGADLVDESGKLTRAGKLGALGPGLGAAADVANLLQGNTDVRSIVSTGLSSLEAAGALRGALTGSKALANAAGKLSLVTTAAFSAWDTYKALDRGDWVGATAAAAPLVGAGIGIGVAVGGGATAGAALTGPAAPIGAAIGAVVGLAIGGIAWMMTPSADSKMEDDTWGATAAMMQSITGDDWKSSVATAKRMRNVDGDLAGAGPQIGLVAKQLGADPHVLLKHIHQQPANVQDWFFDRAEGISTNADSIRDQSEAYSKMEIDDPKKIPKLIVDPSGARTLTKELQSFGFGKGSAPKGLDRNMAIWPGDHLHKD